MNHELYPASNKSCYHQISHIGKGSFGNVYLVKNTVNNKLYANKKISITVHRRYDKQSILDELRILACHNSPYIIRLEDAYVLQNHINLITEYASKGDLTKYIKKYKNLNKPIKEFKIKKYLYQMCNGIYYLHENKIIHRDLKASNIFITGKDKIKLGDLGIIKVLNPRSSYAYTNIGTPYYMSPELYNNKKYSFKTDIWSLGVILYELMTLRLPYNADNMNQLKQKIVYGKWYMNPNCRKLYSDELYDLLQHILQSINSIINL